MRLLGYLLFILFTIPALGMSQRDNRQEVAQKLDTLFNYFAAPDTDEKKIAPLAYYLVLHGNLAQSKLLEIINKWSSYIDPCSSEHCALDALKNFIDDAITLHKVDCNTLVEYSRDDPAGAMLHFAARYNKTSLIVRLIQYGVSIDRQNRLAQTALHIAAKHNHYESVARLLIADADVKTKDRQQKKASDLTTDLRIKGLIFDAEELRKKVRGSIDCERSLKKPYAIDPKTLDYEIYAHEQKVVAIEALLEDISLQ